MGLGLIGCWGLRGFLKKMDFQHQCLKSGFLFQVIILLTVEILDLDPIKGNILGFAKKEKDMDSDDDWDE
jgi:hypothetical protein